MKSTFRTNYAPGATPALSSSSSHPHKETKAPTSIQSLQQEGIDRYKKPKITKNQLSEKNQTSALSLA